jgi:DNA ligase (NAD+)
MGRTGVLTPVAIFEPIDIDGSTVERASLHNITVMQELLSEPYEGQKIEVFKANMIIPQVYSAERMSEDFLHYPEVPFINIPKVCPVCGQLTKIVQELDSKVLVCDNPACEGKLVNQLDHFCGRKGLDIKGLSVATLEKLIDWQWVSEPADLYELHTKAQEWASKPGFGVRSVEKILSAIENSKSATLDSFISAIGIPLIGQNVAKELVTHIDSYEDLLNKVSERFDFSEWDGFAESKCYALWNFDFNKANRVYAYLQCSKPQEEEKLDTTLADKTVVVTGRLNIYKNREELFQAIRAHGGKTATSVSGSTSYLINNDNTSQSAKNLSAKKLGIPILTEEEFVQKYLTN